MPLLGVRRFRNRGFGLLLVMLFALSCSGDSSGTTEPVTPVAASMTVAPGSSALTSLGETVQFVATVRDQTGAILNSALVDWSVDNTSVATISTGGKLTAVSVGSAVVSATSGNASSTVPVSIAQIPASVEVSPAASTLFLSETAQLSATAADALGNPLSNAQFTWSHADPDVATVDGTGLVRAVGAGTTTIFAMVGGVQAQASISVLRAPVGSVEVSPSRVSLGEGATYQLTARVRDSNGKELFDREVSWSSSNPAIAQVGPGGLVTANAAGGPIAITASSEGESASAFVTVERAVASVQITPQQVSLGVGGTVQLVAETRDAGGNLLTGRDIVWESVDAAIAQVASDGTVTALTPGGPVAVSATSEGRVGIAFVTVEAPVASVALTGSGRVKVGDAYAYVVTARTADGTVVSRPVSWGVAQTDRATITQDGRLIPVKAGPISILLTIDGALWQAEIEAYDWVETSNGTSFFLSLAADVAIANRFGTAEYPLLVLSCNTSTGNFFVWVDTEGFVTESGAVTYTFDNGPRLGGTWIELDGFSALAHPGPSNAETKQFAQSLAGGRQFHFGFTEYLGSAQSTTFRVTRLNSLLPSQFTRCPSTSVVDGGAVGERSQRLSDWSVLHREEAAREDPGASMLQADPASRIIHAVRRW